MAKSGRAPRPSSGKAGTPVARAQSAATKKGGGRSSGASSGPRPPAGRAPQGKAGRQSVAAARKSTSGRNGTQLVIGGIALVVIIAVIVVGIVLNKRNTAVQGEGYGGSKASTAVVQNGAIVISTGSPTVSIDLYEDALCPICGAFEAQYGQRIAQLADEGKLKINLNMLNFLDQSSASKNYSTRAYAAMLAVAHGQGSQPGLFLQYHSALYAEGTQPEENASSDLSNEQLAEVAAKVGANAQVQADITAGKYLTEATTFAKNSSDALAKATGGVQTPTVLHDGGPVATNNPKWLDELVGS